MYNYSSKVSFNHMLLLGQSTCYDAAGGLLGLPLFITVNALLQTGTYIRQLVDMLILMTLNR